jgi:hypothetical protein
VVARHVQKDYYAVLQVRPDAEFEVIEGAYRQLMKKYHPDMAGEDPRRIAQHVERATAINEAFGVLRDPERRRLYDASRPYSGATVQATRPPSSQAAPPPTAEPAVVVVPAELNPTWSRWLAPIALLIAAYYLLPGPYEWEDARLQELRAVLVLPIVGVLGFALASGRLSPWLGHAPAAGVLAWALLAIAVLLTMWRSLPRIAIAGIPSLALLSGYLNPVLTQAHVPTLVAWGLLSAMSIFFAARIFIFSVLPTLGLCWFITRVS